MAYAAPSFGMVKQFRSSIRNRKCCHKVRSFPVPGKKFKNKKKKKKKEYDEPGFQVEPSAGAEIQAARYGN